MKYAAFISYRHNERDSFIAENLQHELEHYRIPGKIRKSSGRDKVGRIFRDREELPISNNLEDNIQSALEGSEYLIVICSPESKQSEWVQREVNTFIKLHDKRHVLAVLAKDEPADSFPEILCYDEVETKDAAGNVTTERKPVEPLAAEMRGEFHKDILKEMKVEKLRLLAPILNCSFDDLKQREKEYKTKRIIWAMTAALAVVGVFAAYAIRQNVLLQKQYAAKQVNESKYLAKVSGELLDQGDRKRATQVALQALPEDVENPDRPVVNEAVYALNNSMYSYQNYDHVNYVPNSVFEMENSSGTYSALNLTFSKSGNLYAVQDNSGIVYVYDLKANNKAAEIKMSDLDPETAAKQADSGIEGMCFISDDKMILNYGSEIICVKISDKGVVWKTAVSEDAQQSLSVLSAVSDDGKTAAFCNPTSLMIVDTASGKITKSVVFQEELMSFADLQFCTSLEFSPSGKKLVYSLERAAIAADKESTDLKSAVGVVDVSSGTVTELNLDMKDVESAIFEGEDKLDLISYDIDRKMEVQSLNTAYKISQVDAVTGEEIWSTPEDKVNINSNTKCALSFYKLSDGNRLCAYIANKDFIINSATGEIEESSLASDDIVGMAGYDDRMILMGTTDGKLYMDNLSRKGDMYEIGSIDYDDVSYFGYSAAHDTVIQLKDETQQIVMSTPALDKNYEKLGAFDASSLGYIDNYRYAEHESYGQDDSAAELVVWKVGSNDKCADIKADEGECFCGYYVYGDEDSEMIYYITGDNASSYNELHAYSIKDKKEVGSLKLMESDDPDDLTRYSNYDWGTDKRELLLYNATGFEIIDLKSMKVKETVSKDSDTKGQIFASKDMLLMQALISESGEEVILFTSGEGDSVNRCNVKIWDILGKRIKKMKDDESCETASSITEYCVGVDSNILAYYNGEDICIADLDKMTITKKIPFAGNSCCEFSFIGNDDQLVTWGDDKLIKLWSVSQNKILMVDSQPYQNVVSIQSDNSTDYFGVLETEYAVNVAHNQLLHVYSIDEDGRFSRYADVGTGVVSFDNREAFSNVQDQLIKYPFYSTQELIDSARKYTGGEELSDLDKQKYFISE